LQPTSSAKKAHESQSTRLLLSLLPACYEDHALAVDRERVEVI